MPAGCRHSRSRPKTRVCERTGANPFTRFGPKNGKIGLAEGRRRGVPGRGPVRPGCRTRNRGLCRSQDRQGVVFGLNVGWSIAGFSSNAMAASELTCSRIPRVTGHSILPIMASARKLRRSGHGRATRGASSTLESRAARAGTRAGGLPTRRRLPACPTKRPRTWETGWRKAQGKGSENTTPVQCIKGLSYFSLPPVLGDDLVDQTAQEADYWNTLSEGG